MPIDKRELKEAALAGLRHEQQRITALIARLERELGKAKPAAAPVQPRLSADGRARIVAALKKRWAAVRAAKEAAVSEVRKPAGAKRPAAKVKGRAATPAATQTPETPAN
ncbi:MAG: hypothetical protein ACE15B_14270 [Bryobacteraceae bacterium]